mmetsp:Transcript_153439/g.285982  ORF Transcript_153439/g.285982 Transcript_153439/m.285982 type:complete len:81 (-) Transcript_153439:931-1173(-)
MHSPKVDAQHANTHTKFKVAKHEKFDPNTKFGFDAILKGCLKTGHLQKLCIDDLGKGRQHKSWTKADKGSPATLRTAQTK